MNEILQVKDVKALQNTMPVDGYVYVKDYSQLLTSSGNPYFNINIESDGTLNCKAWSTSEAFKTLGSTDLRNKVVRITAKTNEYNGMISLIINDIYEYTGTELSAVDFLSTPYDLSLYDGFMTFMKGKISLDMYTILEKLMYLYGDAFKNEYASVGHHDNVRHGLLAHSYKVTKIAQVVRFYPGIKDEIDRQLDAIVEDLSGKSLMQLANSINRLLEAEEYRRLWLEFEYDDIRYIVVPDAAASGRHIPHPGCWKARGRPDRRPRRF